MGRDPQTVKVHGQELGRQLCAILGLEPSMVQAIAIYADVASAAEIHVKMLYADTDTKRLVATLRKYELVEKEGGPCHTKPND